MLDVDTSDFCYFECVKCKKKRWSSEDQCRRCGNQTFKLSYRAIFSFAINNKVIKVVAYDNVLVNLIGCQASVFEQMFGNNMLLVLSELRQFLTGIPFYIETTGQQKNFNISERKLTKDDKLRKLVPVGELPFLVDVLLEKVNSVKSTE